MDGSNQLELENMKILGETFSAIKLPNLVEI